MVTLPSSGRSVSFPWMSCSRSKASGTLPTFFYLGHLYAYPMDVWGLVSMVRPTDRTMIRAVDCARRGHFLLLIIH